MQKKQVTYITRLVTYIDILGFRHLLETKSAGEISAILRVFGEVINHDKEDEKDFDRLYESFSDLTIRAVTVSSLDYLSMNSAMLDYELESIARIQVALLSNHNILIRGGIACGPLVKSWDLVYGQGMVKAYEMEKLA